MIIYFVHTLCSYVLTCDLIFNFHVAHHSSSHCRSKSLSASMTGNDRIPFLMHTESSRQYEWNINKVEAITAFSNTTAPFTVKTGLV